MNSSATDRTDNSPTNWDDSLGGVARSIEKRRLQTLNRPALRREAILDLANLPDDQWPRFRRLYRKHYSHWPSDDDLLNWRVWLRQIWQKCDEHDIVFALTAWTDEARKNNWPSWIFDIQHRSVSPNYGVFALSLAVGVNELLPKMALCANPDCPVPYFLKNRKTQRFCDRPACAAFGQRQHKKTWWRKHGHEWKEKWKADRKKLGMKKGTKHAKTKKTRRSVLENRPKAVVGVLHQRSRKARARTRARRQQS